jgi:hypothetical protein
VDPKAWPTHSPHLNHSDFCLWGRLISTVRATKVSDLQILQKRTYSGFQMIRTTRGIIQSVGQSLIRLAASCVEAQGGHFVYFISSPLGRESETTLQNTYIKKSKFYLR